MAYYCESCKLIYPKKYANCPKCGDQIKTNTLNDNDLLSNGYTLLGKKSSTLAATPHNANSQRDSAHSSNDPLNEIRALFELGNTNKDTNNISPNNNVNTTPITYTNFNSPKNEPSTTIGDSTTTNNGGFFDNLDAPQFRITPVDIPQIVQTQFEPSKPVETHRSINSSRSITTPSIEPTTYSEIISDDSTNNQPRAHILRDFQQRFDNFRARHPIQIPWYLIGRLLPYILIIVVIILLWVNREIIFGAIMEFIIGLIPFALIVGAIVYLLYRLFKP